MYLHFNCLIKEFLDLLDEKKLKQKIADNLSYLRKEEQRAVFEAVFEENICSIDKTKSDLLRTESAKAGLSKEKIISIISNIEKPKTKYKYFAFGQLEKYSHKFKTPEEMEKAVIRFLEEY